MEIPDSSGPAEIRTEATMEDLELPQSIQQILSSSKERSQKILIADVLARTGKFAEALAVFGSQNAISRIRSLGDAQFRAGNLDLGIRAYEAIPAIVPNFLLIVCGNQCSRASRYEDAIRAYSMAHSYDHLVELQRLCHRAGRGEVARLAAQEANKLQS